VARHLTEGTVEVDIATLKAGIVLRFDGEDQEHARSLASRLDDCPAILVEKSTMTVIDGAHRVLAARMLGRETIVVRYFTGDHEEAFVEAVKANVAHGKPLTLAEREAAAKTVLAIHNDWSNRLLAHACGLSDKTIGRLRETTAEVPQSTTRIGRDGRRRPTDTRVLRTEIATALRVQPDARPDDLARSLSTSPATVRDVRKRIESGNDPVRPERAVHATRPLSYGASDDRRELSTAPVDWTSDRAILSLPGGGGFAEWLAQTRIESKDWEAHMTEIPLGRIPQLIADAKSRATEWTNFADSLEQRFQQLNRRQA
jgi:ParB-like chromosome segregation protein Spo0J